MENMHTVVEEELVHSLMETRRLVDDGDATKKEENFSTPPQNRQLSLEPTPPSFNSKEITKITPPSFPSPRQPTMPYHGDAFDPLPGEGERRLNFDVLRAVSRLAPERFSDVAQAFYPRVWKKLKEKSLDSVQTIKPNDFSTMDDAITLISEDLAAHTSDTCSKTKAKQNLVCPPSIHLAVAAEPIKQRNRAVSSQEVMLQIRSRLGLSDAPLASRSSTQLSSCRSADQRQSQAKTMLDFPKQDAQIIAPLSLVAPYIAETTFHQGSPNTLPTGPDPYVSDSIDVLERKRSEAEIESLYAMMNTQQESLNLLDDSNSSPYEDFDLYPSSASPSSTPGSPVMTTPPLFEFPLFDDVDPTLDGEEKQGEGDRNASPDSIVTVVHCGASAEDGEVEQDTKEHNEALDWEDAGNVDAEESIAGPSQGETVCSHDDNHASTGDVSKGGDEDNDSGSNDSSEEGESESEDDDHNSTGDDSKDEDEDEDSDSDSNDSSKEGESESEDSPRGAGILDDIMSGFSFGNPYLHNNMVFRRWAQGDEGETD